MADLSITRQNVALTEWFSGQVEMIRVGEAVTQLQPVYSGANQMYWKANAADESTKGVMFVVITPSSAGGLAVAVRSGIVVSGATLTADLDYYLSSVNAGGICPLADLTTDDWIVKIGRAVSTSLLGIGITDTNTQV